VGADAVLAVVEHRAQPERAFEVAPAAFDGEQLLVGGGEIVGGERGVGGTQQPLTVQVRLAFDRGLVDPEQPGRGAPQVAAQPRLGLEAADEFVAAPRGPAIGAGDELGEVRDEVGADLLIAFALLGVVALPAESQGGWFARVGGTRPCQIRRVIVEISVDECGLWACLVGGFGLTRVVADRPDGVSCI